MQHSLASYWHTFSHLNTTKNHASKPFCEKKKFIKALSWKKYPAKKSVTITKRPTVNGYLLLRCPLAFES